MVSWQYIYTVRNQATTVEINNAREQRWGSVAILNGSKGHRKRNKSVLSLNFFSQAILLFRVLYFIYVVFFFLLTRKKTLYNPRIDTSHGVGQ